MTDSAMRYGVAVALVVAALIVSALLWPVVAPNPFILLFAAIAFSAWYGGIGPGLLATALGLLGVSYLLIPPAFTFKLAPLDLLRFATFAAVATLISSLSEARRRAEQAAQAQREQIQVTLASIGDAVITTDTAGRVTFLNAVAERLTGWPLDEARGLPIDQVFPIINAVTRHPVESPVARVLLDGVTVGLANHTLLVGRDGVERPIDDSGAPIADARGRLLGSVLVFRDITAREEADRSRAELLAREQAARARAAFLADASRLLAVSLDYQATLRQVADLAVPSLADWCVVDLVDEAGALQMVATAHTDPERVKWAYQLREEYPVDPDGPAGTPYVVRTGEAQLFPDIPDSLLEAVARSPKELALLREVGYRSIMVVPLRARGRILGALSLVIAGSERRYNTEDVAFAQEVADRAAVAIDNASLYNAARVAFDAAEQTADRIARLQHVTAALGATVTPGQVAELMVDEGLAAIGADAGAVFLLVDNGRTWEAVSFRGYPPDLAPRHVRAPVDAPGPLSEARATRQLVLVETPEELVRRWPKLAAAQERSGDAAFAAVPLLLGNEVLGVLTAAFRAPRRFSLEDASFLEAIGRQCAQALDRAHLYQAERAARADAEDAIRLRDLFLSVASHELKTPLTSLLLQTQLLQRRVGRAGLLPEREQRALQLVADQAQRLDRMIMALLDISRLELGQLSLNVAPLDLCALSRRVVSEIQPTTEAHVLTCEVPEHMLMVMGDELRLEQVLQNLLQNAIKYSPDGGPVDVRVASADGQVCVTVADRGIGLPEEALPHLFERFYRAPNADPRQISGMGIGLYVVKEIVRLHGGTVRAAGQEQGGSLFTVCLPQARDEPPAGPPASRAVVLQD